MQLLSQKVHRLSRLSMCISWSEGVTRMQQQRYTELDLRLGLIPFTEEDRRQIREAFAPVLVRVAKRILAERARQAAEERAAAAKQD
jgi:hypothetical protein